MQHLRCMRCDWILYQFGIVARECYHPGLPR